jgi:hypothetical protein
MQWGIGFSQGNIQDLIREKKTKLALTWIPLANSSISIADPFIFKDHKGTLTMVYEDFSMMDLASYGKIVMASLDKDFKLTAQKEIFDSKSHASYPFVFSENGKTYIIPETSRLRKVSAYEYDFENKCLGNERIIIDNLPLLDSTIFKYNGKYWLFATLSDHQFDHSKLYIYYADNLFGSYRPHANNPVKHNLDGTRPAGSLIEVDGQIYRPTQNCSRHYGASLTINRVTKLSETEFAEEFHWKWLLIK